MEGEGAFTHDKTSTSGQQPFTSQDLTFEERLNLRNSGAYLIDPRLLRLTLGGSFGLSQERFTSSGSTQTTSGTLWGYDTLANVLMDQPVSLTVFANRNQFNISRELSGVTNTTNESRGAILNLRALYIPSTFSVRQDLLDQEVQVSGAVSRQQEDRKVARYEGLRGWADSEMNLVYEFVDDKDLVFPSLTFQSQEAQVNYSLDFGEDLNRHWDSRLRYYNRTGNTPITLWTADETLVVDHTETLRSDYRYSLVRTENPTGANTTQTGRAALRHQLYESLTTTAMLDGVLQSFPQGDKNSIRGTLAWVYTKRLPLGGRLTAAVGGSLQYENDHFDTSQASVSNETHTAATPIALPIRLDNPFVVASSVVVTKIALGPLPIGCAPPPGPPVPLTLGTDYNLQTVGAITEIVPIFCSGTTVGINPGDTISVDYQFAVSPSIAFTTTSWHANLDLDFRWIRFFYLHDQTDQNLVSGQDGRFLNDQQSDTAGGELRYDSDRLHASLLGEARRYRSTQIDYDMLRGSAFLYFAIQPALTLRLNADYVFTQFYNPSRQTRAAAALATLTYALGGNLFVDANAGYQLLEDTAQPTEQLIEAGLHVRWVYRNLEISPSFEYFNRQRGDTTTSEYRALLRTIRRF